MGVKMTAFPGPVEYGLVERTGIDPSGRACVKRVRAVVLTEVQCGWLRRWYPRVANRALKEAMGVSLSTVNRLIKNLGLERSAADRRRIAKRAARETVKKLERNGYYESMRGRRVSNGCLAGLERFWQDVRDGKREHPMAVLAQRNSRRYREVQRRKGEALKGLYRKEELRMVYGLERRTRLKARAHTYTASQRNHRYNALKRGYFVMEDCSEGGGERYNIYYDEDTVRNEKFELNCINDGFRIVGA